MEQNIIRKFSRVDVSDIPPFEECETIIEKVLWVLWVGKDKANFGKITAHQISTILREVKEVSIKPSSITQSLNRAGDKIHRHRENEYYIYEIMKPGKDYLMTLKPSETLDVFYFTPGQRYSSKRILVKRILDSLAGEISIVDPYFGERTLDVIHSIQAKPIKVLTRLDNIRNNNQKNRVIRAIQDIKTENPNIEIRDYPNNDLHDRYIITSNTLILIGQSIKDLGAKESFAIVLDKTSMQDTYEALKENTIKRWDISTII